MEKFEVVSRMAGIYAGHEEEEWFLLVDGEPMAMRTTPSTRGASFVARTTMCSPAQTSLPYSFVGDMRPFGRVKGGLAHRLADTVGALDAVGRVRHAARSCVGKVLCARGARSSVAVLSSVVDC